MGACPLRSPSLVQAVPGSSPRGRAAGRVDFFNSNTLKDLGRKREIFSSLSILA